MKRLFSITLALVLCTGMVYAQHTATTLANMSVGNDVYVDQDRGGTGVGINNSFIELYGAGDNEVDVFQVADGDPVGAVNEADLYLYGTGMNTVFSTQFNRSTETTARINALDLDLVGGGLNELVFHQDGEAQTLTGFFSGMSNGAASAVGNVWLAQMGEDQAMSTTVYGDENGLLLGQYGTFNTVAVDIGTSGTPSSRNLVEIDQGGFLSDRTDPQNPVMTLTGPTDDATALVSILGDDNKVDIEQYVGPGLLTDVTIDGVFNEVTTHQDGFTMEIDVDILNGGYNLVSAWQEGSGHGIDVDIIEGSAYNEVYASQFGTSHSATVYIGGTSTNNLVTSIQSN